MATLNPHVDWRDPDTLRIDQAMPDLMVILTGLGNHFNWTITRAQARHLAREITTLLDGEPS